MIDVKRTIFRNLKKGMDKLRLLANNDTKLFKKILFLIVLDDMYDWSDYLDAPQPIQKRLQELRNNFILCNRDLDICRFPVGDEYVNVNTPQTNNTWRRVWDDPKLKTIEDGSEISKFIYLTDLSEVKVIDGKNYIYSDEVPVNNGRIQIYETSVDNNDYIIK